MNGLTALQAVIRDAMEDQGMIDPEEEIVQYVAIQVEEHLKDEGWMPPADAEPPPGTAEAVGDGTAMRDLSGRELPHPDE